MRTEKWQKIKELVSDVLEIEVSEREAFLEKLDDNLRTEVESLIAFEAESEDLMRLSAVEFSRGFFDEE